MKNLELNYNVKSILKKLVLMRCFDVDVAGLFSLGDCLLTQKFTGKSYTYRVFNINTGENKYLFHRKKPIGQEMYSELADKIQTLPFYNIRKFETGEEMIDYIFKKVFTQYGYSVREDQLDLSKQMFRNMQENKLLLSDVPVGLGKTHAYIIASVVNTIFTTGCFFGRKIPTVITTSSIELQKAIINDYLPSISNMLISEGIISSALTCVLRKGKSHYICHKRLKHYVDTLEGTNKNRDELVSLKELLKSKVIDLDGDLGISNYDKRKINVKKANCFECRKYKICEYHKFIKKAKSYQYDFQICNHNYFLADIIKRKKGMVQLIPDHKDIVIDEAHKLIEAAQSMYGVTIIQNDVNKLIKRAMPHNQLTKANKYRKKSCESASKKINGFFKLLLNQMKNRSISSETEKYTISINKYLESHLRLLILDLKDLVKRISYSDRQLLSDIERLIENLKSIDSKKDICWIENFNQNGQCVFTSIPKSLNQQLKDDLWMSNRSLTLTSGTLAVDNNFSYIKRQVGLDQISQSSIDEVSKETPFDFKKNCMIYISKNMPFPTIDDEYYIKKISEEIYRLIRSSNGHALVLFTSYKPLKLVFNILKDNLNGIPIYELSRGKNEVIEMYKNSRNGVLFATGSLWEGVNIPGDILSHLIIVKLPFPIPDPISNYERSLFNDQREFMNQVLLPMMLMKLKQGVGRLIRKETDTGVISILDSRAGYKGNYHSDVIRALPECRATSEQHDIRIFLRSRKNEVYFE